MEDFAFEMEVAALLGDTDRRDLALMERFPEMRPFDMACFGGWDEPRLEMLRLTDFPPPSCLYGRDCEEDCFLEGVE